MMEIRGIDVSEHNGKIDWKKVYAAGMRFAMVRLGIGNMSKPGIRIDARYRENVDGALAAGLDVGAYVYSRAATVERVIAEAKATLDALAPYKGKLTYPIAYDLEDKDVHLPLSRDKLTSLAAAYCDTIRAGGWLPALYTSSSWLRAKVYPDKINAGVWCAHWGSQCAWTGHTLWQYEVRGTAADVKAGRATVVGSVDGVDGAVDVNISYREYGEDTMVRYKYAYECPEWAQETLRKLDRKGLLKGKGGDLGLDLSEDMLRMLVILDRNGTFGE